jgi:hypothetical protein
VSPALLGIELPSGVILGVCVSDGDPETCLPLLRGWNASIVHKVIQLGDMAHLGPAPAWGRSYFRDDGEDARTSAATVSRDRREFLRGAERRTAEWCYLLDDGGVWWSCYHHDGLWRRIGA